MTERLVEIESIARWLVLQLQDAMVAATRKVQELQNSSSRYLLAKLDAYEPNPEFDDDENLSRAREGLEQHRELHLEVNE